MSQRPPIPAEIRRKVLIEAGHRCSIPTCRHIETDIHHIVPWEKCKTHEESNLISLCPNCHRMAHSSKIDSKSLRIYKANLQIMHDKYSQLELDILFELHNSSEGTYLPWPTYLNLMIKRVLESGYVEIRHSGMQMDMGQIRAAPDLLLITKKGRGFINEAFLLEENTE